LKKRLIGVILSVLAPSDVLAASALAYHGSRLSWALRGIAGPRSGSSAVQHGNERQVAVALLVVQPVADDEAVRDLEPT